MAQLMNYVHGYSDREAERLLDQASSVKNLLHDDTSPHGTFCYTFFKATGMKEDVTQAN